MTEEHDRDEPARHLPDPADRHLSAHRHRQIQEFLMAEMQPERQPLRRPRRRLALAATALAAVVAVAAGFATGGFGLVASTSDTSDTVDTATSQEPASPAATLRLAAAYAAAQSWTDPRPDQWSYLKSRTITGPYDQAMGSDPEYVHEWWYRVDGEKDAFRDADGSIVLQDSGKPFDRYASLPTDPQALIAEIKTQKFFFLDRVMPESPDATDEEGQNRYLFGAVSCILGGNVLPSDVTAALWEAVSGLPGLTQETIEVEGREVIAIGMIIDGWKNVQLLVDPETHAFVGRLFTYAEDHEYADRDVTGKKGEIENLDLRLEAVIVDNVGDTA